MKYQKISRFHIIFLPLLTIILSACRGNGEHIDGVPTEFRALEKQLERARSVYAERPGRDSLYALLMDFPSNNPECQAHKVAWRIRMNFSATHSDTLKTWLREFDSICSTTYNSDLLGIQTLIHGMTAYRNAGLLSAYKDLHKAALYFAEVGDSLNLAYAQSYLGMTFERLSEPDSAEKYFTEAMAIFHRMDADFAYTQLSINLANVIRTRDITEAAALLRHTIERAREVGDTHLHINAAISLWSLAGADAPNAVTEAEKIMELARRQGDNDEQCLAAINLAEAYLAHNDDDNGLTTATEALHMAENESSLWLRFNALPSLINLYDRKGVTDSAYLCQKQYIALADTLGVSIGQQTNTAYSLEMKEAVEDYEKRLEAETRGRVLRNWIIVLTVVCLTVITTAAIVSARNIRRRHQSEREAEELRQRELESRNELLRLQLANQGRELSARAVSMETNNAILTDILEHKDTYTVDTIISRLRSHIREEAQREQYQEIFYKVNPDFFTGLKERAPNLTENELRHCCLIAIGLSIKQISTLMDITPEGVQKARYRLRKKLLADTPDETLESIIRSFYSAPEATPDKNITV